MTDRDWDKELAKIDKQIASYSDDDLVAKKTVAVPQKAAAAAPAIGAGDVVGKTPTRWGVVFRVGLAVALAAAVPFWPYAARCGLALFGYLGAVVVVIAAGTWAAVSTWRARTPRMHIAALAVIAWGAILAARDVLPRTGYVADVTRVAWMCR